MRGQKKIQRLNRGQTIVAERERAESDSERQLERKKLQRKRRNSVIFAILILAALGVLAYTTGKNAIVEHGANKPQEEEYVLKAQIVDEDNRGQVSSRTRNYIVQLEKDFKDLGYTVTQVTLPTGMSRELYVDLAGEEVYFKVNTDRDTAVTAEDAVRVLKYLHEHDLHPQYADVRIEGKAYYK